MNENTVAAPEMVYWPKYVTWFSLSPNVFAAERDQDQAEIPLSQMMKSSKSKKLILKNAEKFFSRNQHQ